MLVVKKYIESFFSRFYCYPIFSSSFYLLLKGKRILSLPTYLVHPNSTRYAYAAFLFITVENEITTNSMPIPPKRFLVSRY